MNSRKLIRRVRISYSFSVNVLPVLDYACDLHSHTKHIFWLLDFIIAIDSVDGSLGTNKTAFSSKVIRKSVSIVSLDN